MTTKLCPKCHAEKSASDFYSAPDRKCGTMSYCKKCFNQYCSEKRIARKVKAIQYKGSKCVNCSLTYPETPYYIFDFHHTDPNVKEFGWRKLCNFSWKRQKPELDKCLLVCSNCHRHLEYIEWQKDPYRFL